MNDDRKRVPITALSLLIQARSSLPRGNLPPNSPTCGGSPGGKLENGETPEQRLNRELREEFEIDVEVDDYRATSLHDYDFGTIELMAYRTYWVRGEFKLNDHAKIAWASIDEVGGLEFAPAYLPCVEMMQ